MADYQSTKRPSIHATMVGLKIVTLGRFAVWLGEERLPEGVWGREKARRLFQFLVTARWQHTAKERIIGELWPELDPRKADRDFKVALNAVQTVLQPGRTARSPSAYISRQGLSYGLDSEAPIEIDAVEFEAGISAGSATEAQDQLQAINLYRNALQLYQGDYLPDTIYEDWSSAERERLTTLYLAGASRLARLLLAEGAEIESIIWSQKVIAIDPLWEEAYRLLMLAHLAGGNRPLALKAYESCRLALIKELGVEPMAETTRLYEELRAD